MSNKTLASICAKHGFPDPVVDAMKKIPTVEVNELTGGTIISGDNAGLSTIGYGALLNGLPRTSRGLARVAKGLGRLRVAFAGDSGTTGQGTVADGLGNHPHHLSYPGRFAAMLQALGLPTNYNSLWGENGIIATGGNYATYRPGVHTSVSHTKFAVEWGGATHNGVGGSMIRANSSGYAFDTTALEKSCDTLKVWYARASNLINELAVKIDGGAATTLPSKASVITGISQAANAVVTAVGHKQNTGDRVRFEAVVGMTEINGLWGNVTKIGTDSYSVDINTSEFTAYTSGGLAESIGNNIYTLSPGLHTIGFTANDTTGGFGALVAGIEAYDSTVPSVDVFNWGMNGRKMADIADDGDVYDFLNAARAIAPDLVVVMLTTNDENTATALNTYGDSLSKFLASQKLVSDVVVSTGPPMNNAAQATHPAYRDVAKSVCDVHGVLFCDLQTTITAAVAAAYWADVLHFNNAGHATISADFINRIFF